MDCKKSLSEISLIEVNEDGVMLGVPPKFCEMRHRFDVELEARVGPDKPPALFRGKMDVVLIEGDAQEPKTISLSFPAQEREAWKQFLEVLIQKQHSMMELLSRMKR